MKDDPSPNRAALADKITTKLKDQELDIDRFLKNLEILLKEEKA